MTGFIIFSLIASTIYIFNDLCDVKEDQKHPIKKYRPIASGKISKKEAVFLIIILLIPTLIFSFIFFKKFFYIIICYIILNSLYTLKLKHIPILDITIIAFNFILRILAGAVIINVEISKWIILVTFTLALFLSLAKRREDILLTMNGLKVRKSIKGYNLELVNSAMSLLGGITIVSYIMYTVSESVQKHFGTDKLYFTALFVIIGILRYFQITFVEQNSGDPSKIVLKDKFLQITILLWLLSFYILVKLGKH